MRFARNHRDCGKRSRSVPQQSNSQAVEKHTAAVAETESGIEVPFNAINMS